MRSELTRDHRSAKMEDNRMRPWIAALLALLVAPALAQQPKHEHEHGPYAGMQQRSVKALSEQQIADLRAGKGMGLALAAELNGYPGPIHVLELGDQLNLSAEQRQRVQQLYEAMMLCERRACLNDSLASAPQVASTNHLTSHRKGMLHRNDGCEAGFWIGSTSALSRQATFCKCSKAVV